MYYDSLLTGKGYVKQNQQINMLGQAVYICLAIGLIYAGLGLTAIVASQLVSTIIRRVLTYKVFFTPELNMRLQEVKENNPKQILKTILEN